jgi:hypothetical protein
MRPRETLLGFDAYLADRGLCLDAVVVGGAALNLLGVISRPTKDCDILYPTLNGEIVEAAKTFATVRRQAGYAIADDWLNNGPASLVRQLPTDWRDHLQTVFRGRAVQLDSLGREDLLRSKLFALCDRALDLGDCIALAPSKEELATIVPWLEEQDGNPNWPAHVREILEDLEQRLRHGV